MNSKVLRTAICFSWILLVACFIIKCLGGNLFSMEITSTWLEEHSWAEILVCTASSYILFSLYYLAICEVLHFKWWVHVSLIPYFAGISALKILVLPYNLYLVIDLVSNFIIPFLLVLMVNGKPKKEHKEKYFRIIVAFVLNCGFQLISTMVRQIGVTVIVENTLAELIMTIDVVIMLLLYWLYSLLNKKKEVEG